MDRDVPGMGVFRVETTFFILHILISDIGYILISVIFSYALCLSRVLRHAQDYVGSVLRSTSQKDTDYKFTK